MIRVVLLVLVLCVPALARDNGQYAQVSPELRQWFRSQKSPKTGGLCCNEADGIYAEEDIRDGRYWTRWGGHSWQPVPEMWSSAIPIGMVRPLCGGTSIGGRPRSAVTLRGAACDNQRDGHRIMNAGHQLIGIARDDGKGPDPFARSRFFSVVANTSEAERRAVLRPCPLRLTGNAAGRSAQNSGSGSRPVRGIWLQSALALHGRSNAGPTRRHAVPSPPPRRVSASILVSAYFGGEIDGQEEIR